MDNQRVLLTGLYKKQTSKGEFFLDVKLGRSYVQIFKNNFKSKDTDPDYLLYLAEPRKNTTDSFEGSDDMLASGEE